MIAKFNRGGAIKEVLNAKNSIDKCTISEYTNEYLVKANLEGAHPIAAELGRPQVGLYKIFVYYEAVVHESCILAFPPPTCIAHPGAVLLHDYWTAYDFPSDLSFVCYAPYTIGNNNIV